MITLAELRRLRMESFINSDFTKYEMYNKMIQARERREQQ